MERFKQLLAEGKFKFQMPISKDVYKHDIPSELVIDLGQTLLFYISLGEYNFNIKGAKNSPVKGIDDKQITATFPFLQLGIFYWLN